MPEEELPATDEPDVVDLNRLLDQHARDILAGRADLDENLAKASGGLTKFLHERFDVIQQAQQNKQEWKKSYARRLQICVKYNLRRLFDPTWRLPK